jgi:hypothetical protein
LATLHAWSSTWQRKMYKSKPTMIVEKSSRRSCLITFIQLVDCSEVITQLIFHGNSNGIYLYQIVGSKNTGVSRSKKFDPRKIGGKCNNRIGG